MPTVAIRAASRNLAPSSILAPPDRLDEPSLRELARDALIVAGFVPLTGFRTAEAGRFVRVTFAAGAALPERLALAWAALQGFDCATDGEGALLVGYSGEMAASEAA